MNDKTNSPTNKITNDNNNNNNSSINDENNNNDGDGNVPEKKYRSD